MPPKIVYHYTTAEGLLGILSTEKIWATDTLSMNDAQEYLYGRDLLLGELQKWAEDNPDRLRAVRFLSVFLNRRTLRSKRYAVCFCESGDLLSQWRGYAGRVGYALGYRTASILDVAQSCGADFDKVIYGDVGHLIARVARLREGEWPPPSMDLYYGVLRPVSLVKHPSFSEEKEWRLLLESATKDTELEPDFRPGGLGVVPYIKVSLPNDALEEVRVGPGAHPEERKRGVEMLLEKLRLDRSVKVEASEAPYRPQ